MTENPVLWTPDAERRLGSAMHRFMTARGFDDYEALYAWSIDDSAAFWTALAEHCDVAFRDTADVVLKRPDSIMDAGWFDGATLNYAGHLLRHSGPRPALIFRGEDGSRRGLSFDELKNEVAAVAAGLRDAGIGRGDRVAAVLPNGIEAVIAMLATTSLGAIWSSCSPDFGANGIVDRFGQIEPRVLFAVDGYFYNGKRIDVAAVVAEVAARIPSIAHVVVADFAGIGSRPDCRAAVVGFEDFGRPGSPLEFDAVPFDHPLFILFSSGTTGMPKCIVHGHGGTLLQHLKEHVLHTDLGTDDRLFYFTTCGCRETASSCRACDASCRPVRRCCRRASISSMTPSAKTCSCLRSRAARIS
jgi:acetoacetyl-CoA synthetase